ncbi:DUF2953 domain-containing protein [Evansella sp. LMS18]|uniref:DUF2953 domain-containing protein n=1 Tax=Evansella sp. LMS18 TaxID=2924033 RepID=UPI0020D0651A|nr:DUF2953 domain-containing protein [Evansella sp. LMS18]UTR11392.1 DUF2953 domain-containing protein [Evansella sp. LMS18]
MNIFLWILVILILLLLIMPFLKLRVLVTYLHDGKNDDLSLQFSIFRIIKYTLNVPVIAVDKESPSIVYEEHTDSALGGTERKQKFTVDEFLFDLRKFEQLLNHVVGFHTIIRKFLKKVSMLKLRWVTQIGAEDAALTGSSSGAVWMIKGNVLGIISNYMRLKTAPEIEVIPYFQQIKLKTSLKCMVSFRIGHAILAGIKVLRHMKKGRALFSKNNDQTAGRDIHV